MANTLTIDASAMNGVNLTTWINEYFAQFTTASTAFYGGTPDSAYGGTYYMNGSQVLATLNELVDETATPTDSGVLLRLDTVRIQLDGVSAAELTNDIFVF